MINSMGLLFTSVLCITSLLFQTVKSDGWGGSSHIFRKQSNSKGQGDYVFGYDIHDPWGASNFRKEKGSFSKKDGSVEGMYGLKDKDGRARLVKYVADKNGFRASIKTNEPGTSSEDAADATYNGADSGKGKWTYDVSIKDSGKGWKNAKDDKKDAWKSASEMKTLKALPKQSSEYEYSAEKDEDRQSDYEPGMKKLKLHVKPQYDYYYGTPAHESM